MSDTTNNVTPFTQTLAHLERGLLNDELSEELSKIVKAVRETGKKGTLTLKLDVSLMKGTEDTVVLHTAITGKAPQLDRAQTIMFSTYDGDLLRDDPKQHSLNLKSVSAQEKTLKTVNAE